MASERAIDQILESQVTMEGAGVRLRRVFGYYQAPGLDPFLLLDEFKSSNPEDYMAGFPWHPHRGIETVTYMITGEVEHGDSIGNSGVIGPGDVQWMTAGEGIIHQEMPRWTEGELRGFQLWVNLPAVDKMMSPRYRGIDSRTIPLADLGPGARAGVIAGQLGGVAGPVEDLVVDCVYADLTLDGGASCRLDTASDYRTFVHVLDGELRVGLEESSVVGAGSAVTTTSGDVLTLAAISGAARALFVSGRPLGEPVAWRGPIVMNTSEELDQAFDEYRDGTFLKDSEAD